MRVCALKAFRPGPVRPAATGAAQASVTLTFLTNHSRFGPTTIVRTYQGPVVHSRQF